MFNCAHLYLYVCWGLVCICAGLGPLVSEQVLGLCQSFGGLFWFAMCEAEQSMIWRSSQALGG